MNLKNNNVRILKTIIKLSASEVKASYENYLNDDYIYGPSLLPGFRSGKKTRKVVALVYGAVSLLPVLDGNYLVTAALVSLPFIVYGIQGIFHRKARKVDLKLKIAILLCFLLIFAASTYFIAFGIRTGTFRSNFSVKAICSIPEIFKKLKISTDEEMFYNAASALDKGNILPYLKKGMIMEGRGDLIQAEYNYKRAIECDPQNYEPRYRLGRIYAAEKKGDKALEMLENVQIRNPGFAPGFYEAAKIYLEKGDISRADRMIGIALQISGNDAEVHRLRARIMAEKRDYKEAVISYSNAIRLNLKAAGLFSEKALVLLESNRLDEALYNIDKAIKLGKNEADYYFIKGMVLFGQNSFNKALDSFKKALELKPGLVLARGWLALTAGEMGDGGTAAKEMEAALKSGEDIAELHFINARLLSEGQNLDIALNEVDRAISLDKGRSAFYSLKGEILLKKGDMAGTDRMLQTALGINDKDCYAYYVKGRYFIRLNDIPKASEAFDRAIELNPYLSRAFAGRAVSASLMNDREKADDLLYAAMKLKGGDYYNYYAKAFLYFNKKRYPGALASINKAIEMNGADVELNELKQKILEVKYN